MTSVARLDTNLGIANKIFAYSRLSFFCKVQQFEEALVVFKVGKECEFFHGCTKGAAGSKVVVGQANLALFQLRYKRSKTIYLPSKKNILLS